MDKDRLVPSNARITLERLLKKYEFSRYPTLHAVTELCSHGIAWNIACQLFIGAGALAHAAFWYFSLRNRSRLLFTVDVIFGLFHFLVEMKWQRYSRIAEHRLIGTLQLAVYSKATRVLPSLASSTKVTVLVTNDIPRLAKGYQDLPVALAVVFFLIPNIALVGILLNLRIALIVSLFFLVTAIFVASIGIRGNSQKVAALRYADKRLSLIREMLQNIAIIKMYSWEKPFADELEHLRKKEHHDALWPRFLDSIATAVSLCGVGVGSGLLVILAPSELRIPEILITLKALMVFIYQSFGVPVQSYRSYSAANIAYHRLAEFLSLPEGGNTVQHIDNDGQNLDSINVSVKGDIYQGAATAALTCCVKDLDLNVKSGEFIVICGPAGSGKTAILLSMLGQAAASSSTNVKIQGSVGSVIKCWIESGTLRDNIVFGNEWDSNLYDDVLDQCRLNLDIEYLPDGDLTELGNGGIKLSCGQEARVSLARCLYARPDILLIDGILGAVDGFMQEQLVNTLYELTRAGHIVILSSNDISALQMADKVLWLNFGDPLFGTLSELLEDENFLGMYGSLLNAPMLLDDELENLDYTAMDLDRDSSNAISSSELSDSECCESPPVSSLLPPQQLNSALTTPLTINENTHGIFRVLSDEKIDPIGLVDMVHQLQVNKQPLVVFLLELAGIATTIRACCRALSVLAICIVSSTKSRRNDSRLIHLPLIIELIQLFAVFSTIQLCAIAFDGISRSIHRRTLSNLLHARLSFFATFPLGRLLTRFTTDMNMVQQVTPQTLQSLVILVFGMAASTLLISWASSVTFGVIFAITLVAASYFCRNSGKDKTLQQLVALQSSSRSAYAAEKLDGLPIMIAFQKVNVVLQEISDQIDEEFNLITELEDSYCCSSLIAMAIMLPSLVVVPWLSYPSAQMVRIALVRSLTQRSFREQVQMIQVINPWNLCRISLARMKQLETNVPQEPYSYNTKNIWRPHRASIRFNDVSFRYDPALPCILNNFNLVVEPKQKIGICGRSGVGKTTIFNALLRVADPVCGKICIDGQDISKLGVEELRNSLAVLPQQPVLFSGNVRCNLDPFQQHSDEKLRAALLRVNMNHVDLNSIVATDGVNFSASERQMLALARCFLRDSRIILLDEPTSAVDPCTDATVQREVMQKFSDTTVLCIAHRLKTILHYDQIVVVGSNGTNLESGQPKELYNRHGIFWEMCQDSGISDEDFR